MSLLLEVRGGRGSRGVQLETFPRILVEGGNSMLRWGWRAGLVNTHHLKIYCVFSDFVVV